MCQHYWVLGEKQGDETPAVCKYCGETTTFEPVWKEPTSFNRDGANEWLRKWNGYMKVAKEQAGASKDVESAF